MTRPGQRCGRCWWTLATSPTVSHRLELAAEADLPDWVAERLSADREPMVRIVMAGRDDVGPELLRALLRDPDPGVRASVAGNPAAPGDVDVAAAIDVDPEVVIRLAGRPGTRPELLTALCTHPDRRVRGAVAANPTAGEVLDRAIAGRETDPVVLGALATKTTTPAQVLTWLARHPAPAVADPARRQLSATQRSGPSLPSSDDLPPEPHPAGPFLVFSNSSAPSGGRGPGTARR